MHKKTFTPLEPRTKKQTCLNERLGGHKVLFVAQEEQQAVQDAVHVRHLQRGKQYR